MDSFHLADRAPVAEAIEAAAACNTLDELYAAIAAYKGHPVAEREPFVSPWPASNPVANPDGPLMIVIAKPVPEDVGKDRPFTGMSHGWAMEEVLKMCDIDITQIHTTFACHWNPGGEKSPNATQIAASRPFLFREIELVRPRAIMAQGREVLDSMFLYRDPIAQVLGMTMAFKRGDLRIPTYMTWGCAFAERFKTQMGDFGDQVRGFFEQFGTPDGRPMPQRWRRAA
jgi:uracil-DNA glycosylase family 4